MRIEPMKAVKKARSFDQLGGYDKAYWWAKTPEERLGAARRLIEQAKAIYKANPANPALTNGDRILKLRSLRSADADERGRR